MIPREKKLTSSINMLRIVGKAEEDFLILTGETNFLILFVTRGEDIQIMMSLGFFLLIGTLILSPSWVQLIK